MRYYLLVMVFFNNGEVFEEKLIEQPSLPVCMRSVEEWLNHNLSVLDARSIYAGCTAQTDPEAIHP